VVVLVVAGGALVVGRDPVGWAQARWYDVRDTLEPVRVEEPAVDPPDQGLAEFGPELATDGNKDTAWATGWTGGAGGTDRRECGDQPTTAGLVLTLERAADLREVVVLAGLPGGNPDRLVQNRPRAIELRFSDGDCQVHGLRDLGAEQSVELRPLESTTTSVRVDVVDVYPPPTGASDRVAISEIAFQARPAR
jgi:hypothetical protein